MTPTRGEPRQDKIALLDRIVALLMRVGFAVLGAWVIIAQQNAVPAERDYTLQLIGVALCGPFVVAGFVSILKAARGNPE